MQHPRQQPALAGTPDPFKEISADTPVILDFDETLWLRNSTEMYLKCLWPRLPAVLILLLQLFRSVGYAFFLPATLVGAALCITHVLVSWLPYLAYRYGGVRIATPDRLLYVLHFLLITLTIGLLSRDLDALLTWQSAAILVYFGWRASTGLPS